eukprot:symbB.v1.2.004168.t1/scaffold235.1/size321457/27
MRSDLAVETRILSKDNPAVFLKHMEGVSQYTKERRDFFVCGEDGGFMGPWVDGFTHFKRDMLLAQRQQEMLEKQEADRAAYFQQMRDKQSKMLAAYEAGVGNELEKKMREDEERAKRYQAIAEEKEKMKLEMKEKKMKEAKKASHDYIQMQLQERQIQKQQAREEELLMLQRLKAQDEALAEKEKAKVEAKRRALEANAENLREQIRLKSEETPTRYARDQMNEVEKQFNKTRLQKALTARVARQEVLRMETESNKPMSARG